MIFKSWVLAAVFPQGLFFRQKNDPHIFESAYLPFSTYFIDFHPKPILGGGRRRRRRRRQKNFLKPPAPIPITPRDHISRSGTHPHSDMLPLRIWSPGLEQHQPSTTHIFLPLRPPCTQSTTRIARRSWSNSEYIWCKQSQSTFVASGTRSVLLQP